MEGGLLHWKIQKISNNSIDLDSYGKPLPPPPHGFYWERHIDGSWELKHFNVLLNNNQSTDNIIFHQPSVLEHVVMPEDTIQGICLRYRINATALRRHNIFSGNNIQGFQSLRIPLDHNLPVKIQDNTEDILLQKFKNLSGEGTAESRMYLEDHDWNINKAFSAWKGDEAWSNSHSMNSNNGFNAETEIPVDDIVKPIAIKDSNKPIVMPVSIVYHKKVNNKTKKPVYYGDYELVDIDNYISNESVK
mmetsp:Transcript_24816/g.22536  ORF Transcript_24816/g.22536 Transcript_24816/m.22536 type:complete len:247 (+) Transcript_24816:53-793(+)